MDEWTSAANRRYFNINLHGKDVKYHLGMIRIKNSFTSVIALACITEHLSKFDLNISEHIVAMTCDGASVMVKIGKLSPMSLQLCVAHGIHLSLIHI